VTWQRLQETNGNVPLFNAQGKQITNDSCEGSYEKEPKAPKKKSDKPAPAPAFTKKENATLAQCIEILDWYHKNGQNQSKTVQHFNLIYPNLKIKQPLVLAWVKEEAKWHELWEQANHQSDQTAKRA